MQQVISFYSVKSYDARNNEILGTTYKHPFKSLTKHNVGTTRTRDEQNANAHWATTVSNQWYYNTYSRYYLFSVDWMKRIETYQNNTQNEHNLSDKNINIIKIIFFTRKSYYYYCYFGKGQFYNLLIFYSTDALF